MERSEGGFFFEGKGNVEALGVGYIQIVEISTRIYDSGRNV